MPMPDTLAAACPSYEQYWYLINNFYAIVLVHLCLSVALPLWFGFLLYGSFGAEILKKISTNAKSVAKFNWAWIFFTSGLMIICIM